jgi:hypothetical protein
MVLFVAAHESAVVLVFGRRQRETFRRLSWPASKNRQGTKRRYLNVCSSAAVEG